MDPQSPAVTSTWTKFERAGWEDRSVEYHRFFARLCQSLAPRLLDLASATSGLDILDLCCGPGYVAHAAREIGANAVGVDFATSMVELAQRETPSACFLVADAAALPLPPASFNAVICNFGLHHLSDPVRAIAECGRVLRPGGRLVATAWNEEVNDIMIVPASIYAVSSIPDEIPAPPPTIPFDDASALAELLEPAGLKQIPVEPIELRETYDSAEALWNDWIASAIRTRAVYDAQDEDTKLRARTLFEQSASELVAKHGALTLQIKIDVLVAAAENV